eukprot:9329395-Pyramimonas_sp.AAC.1
MCPGGFKLAAVEFMVPGGGLTMRSTPWGVDLSSQGLDSWFQGVDSPCEALHGGPPPTAARAVAGFICSPRAVDGGLGAARAQVARLPAVIARGLPPAHTHTHTHMLL